MRTEDVSIVEVQSLPTAVVRFSCSDAQLGESIRKALRESGVYEYLRPLQVAIGLNVICYQRDCAGLNVELGVLLEHPIEGNDSVFPSHTPGGRALWCRYWGDYSGLGEAYAKIEAEAKQSFLSTSGIFWEVYGHWHDDPGQNSVDVYHVVS